MIAKEKLIEYTLFSDLSKDEYLMNLITDLGIKNIYDCASQCNRCGYCYQHCPSYLVREQESFSGRGRNQLIKMLVEQRLSLKKDSMHIQNVFSTCLLCAGCMSACYGKVPTHKNVIEAKRSLIKKTVSKNTAFILNMLLNKPKQFRRQLKKLNFYRAVGLLKILQKTKFLNFLGRRLPEKINSYLGKPVFKFFTDGAKKHPVLSANKNKEPKCLYFISCTANFIHPEIADATINLAEKFIGTVKMPSNMCCGVLNFNYLGLKDVKKHAEKIISLYENISDDKNIPIVTDCSSCAAHLKNFPELFLSDDDLHKRALAFSSRIKDISEIIDKNKLKPSQKLKNKTVTYHYSSCAYHKQGLNPIELVKIISNNNFSELTESTIACGGELGFNFRNSDMAEILLKRKVSHIADTQSDFIATSDGFSLAFIEYGLKRYYPLTRIKHLSNLMWDAYKDD